MAYKFLSTILGIDANFTGNVGVGTTTPSYKLDVVGNGIRTSSTTGANLTVNETGGNVGDVASLYLLGNNGGWGGSIRYNVGAGGANNRVDFYTGVVRSFSIASTANVLIGTTTDAGYKLDVNGTVRIITSLQVGNFTPGVAASASTIFTNGRISASGGITFYNPAAGDNQETGFKAGGNGVAIYVGNATVGSFGGPGGSTNPNLNLTSGFNPNSGATDKTLLLINPTYQTSGTYTGGIIGVYYNPTLTSIAGTAYHRAIQTVTGDVYLASTSGNVGIGSAPSSTYKLDVNGTARIQGNTTITATNIPLSITGGGSSAFSMNSGNDVYFAFNSQSVVGRFYANPQATVQNTYNQPVSVGFVGTIAGGDVWYGNMNGSGGTVKYNCSRNGVSHSHIWYYNFSEQMRLQYTGNLLIGTSTDAGYKLDVNGTTRINSTLSLTNSSFAGTFNFYLSAANTMQASSSNVGTWLQVGGGNTVSIIGQAFNSTARGNSFGNTVGGEAISATTIIAQSSGTTATTGLSLRYTINNTGTYSGISRGIYYNPTITSLTGTTHRAIETVTGDIYFASTSGNVGIGTAPTSSYKLDLIGTARVSGTTTLTSLGGGGTQMVVADNTGVLSTQAIPVIPTRSYGAWQEDTTQTAPASNIGYGIKFSIADISGHGVNVINDPFGDATYIEMVNGGTYNIQFSLQLQNTDGQIQDVTIWLRKNGNTSADDIPATAGFVSVPNSHGGAPGTIIAAWNYFVEAAPGDFYQLAWSTTDHTRVSLEYYPAGSPPPSAASAILTVNQVD
jgi:hypothetical protein